MDINQQLEYLNLSADVLTEKDVIDNIVSDTKKIVSAKGIYDALQSISADISANFTLSADMKNALSTLSTDLSEQNLIAILSSNSELCADLLRSINKIASQLTGYQKAGSYISSASLDNLATKQFVEDKNYLTSHQSLESYYTKGQTSSDIQLRTSFANVGYQILEKLSKEDFNNVIKHYINKDELSSCGFLTSHQSLSDYYTKSQTSSCYELSNKFLQYYNKKQSLSKSEMLMLLQDYAQLKNTYSKNEVDDIISYYALSDDVAIANMMLNDKIDIVSSMLSDYVTLTSDSSISADVRIFGNVNPFTMSVDFVSLKNLSPHLLYTNEVNQIEDYNKVQPKAKCQNTLYELCEKLNETVLKFDLPIDLIDTAINTSCDISVIYDTLNKINDYVNQEEIPTSADISSVISSLNNDLALLSGNVYTYDIEQSLSSLANKSVANDRYISHVKSLVDNIMFEMLNFCNKNYTSSSGELAVEFSKHYDKLSTYNKDQIDFLIKDFIKGYEVSSASDLVTEFAKYAKQNTLSDYVKLNRLNSYVLSTDLDGRLKYYLQKSEMSSVSQLDDKFKAVEKQLDDCMKLTGDVNISGNLNVSNIIRGKIISSDIMRADFANITNLKPKYLLSVMTKKIDNFNEKQPDVGKLYTAVNTIILDSRLSTNMLDVSNAGAASINELLNSINSINDITHNNKLSEKSRIEEYVASINTNIEKLSTSVSSFNLQQSLSTLADKIDIANNKISYNSQRIDEINLELNNGYPKSQTSSAYQLQIALSQKQNKGDYVNKGQLSSYYDKKYIDNNLMSLLKNNSVSSYCSFNNNVYISSLTAGSINADFANIFDNKQQTCLSSYLLFLVNESVLEIVNRINEIILYCDFGIPLIMTCTDLYNQIIVKTNKICLLAGVQTVSYNATMHDVQNALNLAIYKLNISKKLSLQTILQNYQHRNMVIANFEFILNNKINALSDSFYDYAISNDIAIDIISNDIDDIRNSLSGYVLTYELEDLSNSVDEKVYKISSDLSNFSNISTVVELSAKCDSLSNSLSDYTLVTDTKYLSTQIDELSDIMKNYALLSSFDELRDSLTSYIKKDDLYSTLALSTYEDLKLNEKFQQIGYFVSCDNSSIGKAFGTMEVSGSYEDGETFAFVILTSDVLS